MNLQVCQLGQRRHAHHRILADGWVVHQQTQVPQPTEACQSRCQGAAVCVEQRAPACKLQLAELRHRLQQAWVAVAGTQLH